MDETIKVLRCEVAAKLIGDPEEAVRALRGLAYEMLIHELDTAQGAVFEVLSGALWELPRLAAVVEAAMGEVDTGLFELSGIAYADDSDYPPVLLSSMPPLHKFHRLAEVARYGRVALEDYNVIVYAPGEQALVQLMSTDTHSPPKSSYDIGRLKHLLMVWLSMDAVFEAWKKLAEVDPDTHPRECPHLRPVQFNGQALAFPAHGPAGLVEPDGAYFNRRVKLSVLVGGYRQGPTQPQPVEWEDAVTFAVQALYEACDVTDPYYDEPLHEEWLDSQIGDLFDSMPFSEVPRAVALVLGKADELEKPASGARVTDDAFVKFLREDVLSCLHNRLEKGE